jgi:hypothetical protein
MQRYIPASYMREAARYALYCGTAAGIASNAAVVAAARAEGRSIWRPLNATSHWLMGQQAGRMAGLDLSHTMTGAATNHAASMFWGAIFGAYLASRGRRSPAAVMRDAAAMGGIATLVDYGFMPRRLTPGWELALPKRSVALGMGAMALGLGIGAIAAQRGRR